MTLLLAERTGPHTGDLVNGRAPAEAPGALGSVRLLCTVEVGFFFISLLSIFQSRLHSESLRKPDWLHQEATTAKPYYTPSSCKIPSKSKMGFHKQKS